MKILRSILALAAMLTLIAPHAGAIVLWDQSDFDPAGPGFFNSESGGPPFGLTIHTVCDVSTADMWAITDITTYYSNLDPFWGAGIFQGYLHVWPKTGPMPTEDPTISMLVNMTGTDTGTHIEVKASGLTVAIGPGDYWIGITPIAASGPFGPEIHLASGTLMGDASPSYDVFGFPAPMWVNFTPGADAAILIEGDRTVPVEGASWGAVKSMFED